MLKEKSSILFIFYLFLGVCCFSGTAFAERMSVSVPIANIRSGPGSNYEVLWNVEKYHPVNIIEKKGDWYKFSDFEGDKAWVHKSLLDNTQSVITKKNKCNVRSGAGTKYTIVFTVEKAVPFKVLEKKGNWLHIQHSDGDKGWIHNSLVW